MLKLVFSLELIAQLFICASDNLFHFALQNLSLNFSFFCSFSLQCLISHTISKENRKCKVNLENQAKKMIMYSDTKLPRFSLEATDRIVISVVTWGSRDSRNS